MNQLPIVRLEIESIRFGVQSMLIDRNEEIKALVEKAFIEQLSESAIIAQIDNCVRESISKTIKGLAGDYRLQEVIKIAVVKSLENAFEKGSK